MIFGFLVNIENTIAIYSCSTRWTLFPQKWCVAPEFLVLISSHCSTQIWRIRYGGSWSIYFLIIPMLPTLEMRILLPKRYHNWKIYFQNYKQWYLIHNWSDKALKCTIGNLALPSMHAYIIYAYSPFNSIPLANLNL